jgi:hypothetical protein
MGIRSLILDSAFMAGGILTAKAYHSGWEQACLFTSTQIIVKGIFSFFLLRFVNSGPQVALYSLALKSVCCVAGVLLTKNTLCKQMPWHSAVASTIFAPWAANVMSSIFMSAQEVAVWKV